MKKKIRRFTPEEDAVIRELYTTHTSVELGKKLGRSAPVVCQRIKILGLVLPPEILYERKRMGLKAGWENDKSRFKKGHTPWNKDVKGLDLGGKETQFKKGNKPHNHKPVGSMRVDVDGYVMIKIEEPRKWKPLHRHVWELVNGPLPRKAKIAFKDGNKLNCDISNLEQISDEECMRRNTIQRYPEELKEVIRTLAKLNRKIKKDEEKYAE